MRPFDSNQRIYRFRFPLQRLQVRHDMWKILAENFFQRYIPETSTLLDFGCGLGEFLGNIRAAKKIGVDRENLLLDRYCNEIEFFNQVDNSLNFLATESVDVIFASNVFEHFRSKDSLDEILRSMHRCLRANSRLIVLTPNIRLEPRKYWDYYDHHLALSERSVCEALVKAGFDIEVSIARFLPWSSDVSLPLAKLLLRIYLRMPLLWIIFGKQSLIVGVKAAP